MKRAFASLDACIHDSVLSACGAYDSASLERIFQCIEQREERFFNDGSFWKRL